MNRFEESQPLWKNPIAGVLLVVETLIISLIIGAIMWKQGQADPTLMAVWGGTVLFSGLVLGWSLRTRVDAETLRVRAWPISRTVVLGRIDSAEAITISPLTDVGGWGVKWSRKHGLALLVYGERGVALAYRDESGKAKRMFIGSQRADELAGLLRPAGVAVGASEAAGGRREGLGRR